MLIGAGSGRPQAVSRRMNVSTRACWPDTLAWLTMSASTIQAEKGPAPVSGGSWSSPQPSRPRHSAEADPPHQGRAVHLRWRPERRLGAMPVVGTLRLPAPDPGRQLRRSGFLIDVAQGETRVDRGRRRRHVQRQVRGVDPAPVEGPTIQVGGAESHEARCRRCHDVPRRDRAQRELLPRRGTEGWEGIWTLTRTLPKGRT